MLNEVQSELSERTFIRGHQKDGTLEIIQLEGTVVLTAEECRRLAEFLPAHLR